MAAVLSDNTCCRLEGKLFTGVQLERIFERSGNFQSDASYNVPLGQNLKDEVARAYRIASSAYLQFKRVLEHPSYTHEVKEEATRAFARAFFSSALGYNLPKVVNQIEITQGHGDNQHQLTYPVAMLLDQEEELGAEHAKATLNATTNIIPLQGNDGQRISAVIPLTVVYPSMDAKTNQRSTLDSVLDACAVKDSAQPKKVGRRSPFAMTQELLNVSADYLWGMAFNGLSLRLLRDVMSFARPSFVEFDLQSIFEGDNQAEFGHLYLMLHSSRTKVDPVSGLNIWEEWLKLCAEEGIPAREQLSVSLQEAMQCLGTGFLQAKGKGNDALRAKLANHELSASDYNHQLIRLMYRFIFVFCLEERGIIHTRYTERSLKQAAQVKRAEYERAQMAAKAAKAAAEITVNIVDGDHMTAATKERVPNEQYETSAARATQETLAQVLDVAQVEAQAEAHVQAETELVADDGPLVLDLWSVDTAQDQYNSMMGGGDTGVLSDRELVLPGYARACKLYEEGYSFKRLRDRALLQRLYTDHHDLWLSVKVVFKALAKGEEILALPALGGLFDESQCPDLMAADVNLTNANLLHAMHLMRWANLQGVFTVIDYRNMSAEELGSIYEGMLELVPQVHFKDPSERFSFSFEFVQGSANEHKSTGSYYTPDSLVQSLIKTALDPVIEQKLKEHPEDHEGALLSLKVIDPACGSGHFLLAAARRITERIMQQKAFLEDTEEVEYRKILHKVIANCIYGVDLNPMAVELARMGLWLESVAENRPLSFIDHHLKVGNSLLGVMDLNVLKLGISSEAYKPQAPIGKGQFALTLSDKAVCSTLKKRNTKERKIFAENQHDTGLNGIENLSAALQGLGYADLNQLTEDTLQAEELKAQQNERNQHAIADSVEFKACNLLLSAFLSEKTTATEHLVPTTKDIDLLLTDPEDFEHSHKAMLEHAAQVCAENQVLHWPFAFVEVMAQGGFDCVLGNPPWDPKFSELGSISLYDKL